MKRIGLLILTIALLPFVFTPAFAQNYPSRTVTIIVPFPPGGSVDGVARIVVDRLNATLGPHFIIENRAGASGSVGTNTVARADADGYTLLLTASTHAINPLLYKNLPFDAVKDFTPITLIASGPLIISTTPRVPANNLKDFFTWSGRTRRNTHSPGRPLVPPAILSSNCSSARPRSIRS
jgi:tripartite-type tricarboxylate transporter receptor subunit TctC